jgi:molecular chaperone DnaJ
VQQAQRTIFGTVQAVVPCNNCQGSGHIPEKRCKHCGGDGVVKSESKLTVKIPAGIDNGESIRLSGHGESAGHKGSAGDLYITVHVKPDPRFERDGFEIYTDVTISYPQAVLGDTVDIDTLDGKKKIVIPEGTQPHQQIRLKGLGIPHVRGSGRGDQYVRVVVDVPKKISKNVRALLEELNQELKK